MRAALLERGPEIRRWILLVAIAGAPVVFWRGANEPFNVPKLTLLMVAVAVVAALRLAEWTQGAPLDGLRRALVPVLMMTIPLVLAWVFSPYKAWSLFGEYSRFQGLVPYLVVFLLGLLVADAFEGQAHRVAWALFVGGSIVAGYALLQVFDLDPFGWDFSRGGGAEGSRREEDFKNWSHAFAPSTLGNINFTGSFLAIALPSAIGLWFAVPERRRVLTVGGVGMLAALYFTSSLGPWVAAVAGVAVIGSVIVAPRLRWARIVGLLAALGCAGVVVLGVVAPLLDPDGRFASKSGVARALWWKTSVSMMAHRPITGWGPNTFSLAGVRYRPPEDAFLSGTRFSEDPHSLFAAWMAGTGVLGAAGLVALFGWAGRRGLAADDEGDRTGELVKGIFLAGAASYLVQSLVSIDEISLRTAFWACIGGLAVRATAPITRGKKATGKKKPARARIAPGPLRAPAAVAAVGVALLVAWWGAARFFLADTEVRHATDLFRAVELEEGIVAFNGAIDNRDDAAYRRYFAYWLEAAARDERFADDPEVALPLYEEMRRTFAYVPEVPDLRAITRYLEALSEAPEFVTWAGSEIDRFIPIALEIDPLDPELRALAARLLVERGDPEEAARVLEPAFRLVEEWEPQIEGKPLYERELEEAEKAVASD